ncbi:MAG: FtsW/RodA/SpoVE family cell cycle protein [Candidatus Shapirobacteria bacterium]
MRKIISLPLIISLIILCSLNLLMISSLAPQLFWKQLFAWILGIILFIVGTQINPKQVKGQGIMLLIISCIILLIPIITGNFIRGSRRWLYIGPISVQPSEIVKGPLMLFLSTTTMPLLHLIPVGIIMLQPDLGSAITVFILMIPIILYNKKLLRLSIFAGIILILASPLAYKFILKDYQRQRIEHFLKPASDPLGQGYNLIQSQIAIGSGGLFGKGYRQGTQGQLLFLPEKHSDFIFSATTEELGLFAVILMLSSYFLIIKTLLSKAFSTTNNLPLFLFTLGIAFEIWAQTFINIGMNLGLLPVTGIPLPFMSVGGNSIMALLFSLGIISSA